MERTYTASMSQLIGFYGAAETVTGSRHLLTLGNKKVLVDCGMFQGPREIRDRNWAPFPIHPDELDAVVITHAHMDHIGWLPRLVKQGYQGPIYATPATIGLSKISLPDSGRIQEEDAHRANKHGSQHSPALPLYDEREAYECLKLFKPVSYNVMHELPGGATWRFMPAGHILGSAMAEIYFENGERILMSGDLGRYNTPIINDPTTVENAEYLVVESTYGDKIHPVEDPLIKLESILNDAFENGSAVLIPSFAIGRTQELLYYFRQLQNQGRMPRIPIFIDSPMAVSTTKIYADCREEHDADMRLSVEEGRSELEPAGVQFIRDRDQSKALNNHPGPIIVIAGSGMANGGRILHHMMHRIANPSTIVCFTGYQAEGTLGRRLIEGAETVKIFHEEVRVRARIEKLNALSAHADQGEIMRWLHGFKNPPRRTFIVHGEPGPQAVLKAKIEAELGWNVTIPHHGDQFSL